MRTLWVIAGMRRSGIHAVVHWIRAALDAAGEPHLLLNNVHLATLNRKDANVLFSPNYAASPRAAEHVLIVFEDKRLGQVAACPLLRHVGAERTKRVVVLRDPYNLAASRLQRTRAAGNRDTHPRRVAEMWPDHARHDATWTPCVYNAWFAQAPYRRRLAAALGLATVPPLPSQVARAGRGSSFDGVRFDGRTQEMPVLDRWRRFALDAEFRQYVDHPLLAALSEQVCGFPNPLQEAGLDS